MFTGGVALLGHTTNKAGCVAQNELQIIKLIVAHLVVCVEHTVRLM